MLTPWLMVEGLEKCRPDLEDKNQLISQTLTNQTQEESPQIEHVSRCKPM